MLARGAEKQARSPETVKQVWTGIATLLSARLEGSRQSLPLIGRQKRGMRHRDAHALYLPNSLNHAGMAEESDINSDVIR